jgi:hypothetical protein
MIDIERLYLRPTGYRYRLLSSPIHEFIVGSLDGAMTLAGVIQEYFLVMQFTDQGCLIPESFRSYPVDPIPEDARYFSNAAREWFIALARNYSIVVSMDDPIEVQRFFLRESDAPLETFLNWCPGPIINGSCPYLPVGIDDLPWSMQAFLKNPESYPPEERQREQHDVEEYWSDNPDFIFWWQNSFFINGDTGEVVGT